MKRRLSGNYSCIHESVWLYRVVFATKVSVVLILLLFLSFVVQPFHQAYANEEADEPETVLPEEVEEQLPNPAAEEMEAASEPVEENESSSDTAETTTNPTSEDTAIENDTESEIQDTTSSSNEPSNDTSEPATNDDTVKASSSDATTSEQTTDTTATTSATTGNSTASSTATGNGAGGTSTNTASTTASSTEDAIGSTTSSTTASTTSDSTINDGVGGSTGGDTASSSDEEASDTPPVSEDSAPNDTNDEPDDSVEEDTGTTSDDLIDGRRVEEGVNNLVNDVVSEVVNLSRQLVTEETYYQFSRQSCVAVGDGTYHCSTKTDLPMDSGSAVYAEQDAEGDLEIFMRTSKGEVKQLTDNQYDDSSPDADLATMQVVWQRLIDGRYQVISYDLETQEETQLTFSRNNNMEPKISQEGIVWQAWDGNDWEIMFFDRQFTDQITDNQIQDVTPVVEDGYILWSVLGGPESEARVYEIETGEMMTIAGHDGGTVANPRFVLVYDTRFENGDIITQGFDPVTGLAQPISAKPGELPFDIPEPDPVGEIRALIQNKSSQDGKEIIIVPDSPDGGDLNLASSTATSTGTLNLDDVQADVDSEQGSSTPPTSEIELDEFDLVITDTASSTSAEINEVLLEMNVPSTTPTTTVTATSTQS